MLRHEYILIVFFCLQVNESNLRDLLTVTEWSSLLGTSADGKFVSTVLLDYSVLLSTQIQLSGIIHITTGFVSLTLQILPQILTLSLLRYLLQGGGCWESSRQNRVMQNSNGKIKDKSQRNITDHSPIKLHIFLDI